MKSRYFMLKTPILLASIVTTSVVNIALHAEITTDGSLGNSVNLNAPDYQITQDLGKRVGDNLFHSFETFNIFQGESATFSGDDGIQNVISRVTGGETSTIDGVFRNTILNSDTYFINPAGVLFGENAQLDVQGSFHVSTADYLRSGENEKFHANLSKNSVLSVASPSAFGFLSHSPKSITTQNSKLSVPYSKTLSLIGGDLALSGQTPVLFDENGLIAVFANSALSAQGGRVNLVSVGSQGEVILTVLGVDLNAKGGNTKLNNTLIDASGMGGGSVFIRGGELFMQDSSIQTTTLANQDGQNIDFELQKSTHISGDIRALSTLTFGSGKGGNIVISSPYLEVATSVIDSSSFGIGNGGDLDIESAQIVFKDGVAIGSAAFGVGQAGDIHIKADKLSLSGLYPGIKINPVLGAIENFPTTIGSMSLGGYGNGGDIIITVNQLDMDSAYVTTETLLGEGNAGNISIQADNMQIKNGAWINSSTFGHGLGGHIDLKVDTTLLITGAREIVFSSDLETLTYVPSAIGSASYKATGDTRVFKAGESGDITISVPTLIVDDRAIISAGTGTDSAGGNITIHADNIKVNNGALINSSTGLQRGGITYIGSGQGGSIELNADQLILKNSGMIAANSMGIGNAGTINLQVDSTNLINNGTVTTSANFASGGNITLAGQSVLYLNNGQLTTSVGGGKGNGGNITLNPEFIVMDNGKIIARAVEGHGGNIDIETSGIYRFPPENQNPIDASSQLGVDGVVTVDSPDVDVSGQLIVLSANFSDASNQIKPPCSVQLSKNKSSFVIKKLYGSPSSPQDWQSNILIVLPKNDKQHADFKDKLPTNSNIAATKTVKITCAKNLN